MTIGEIIAIVAALLIIVSAVIYIIKAKKSGQKCIGCPYSKTCSSSKGGCSCGCSDSKKRKQRIKPIY